MPEQLAHAWFKPRLQALHAEAQNAGYGTDIFIAVITDIINGAEFAIPMPLPDEGWARDIGEPAGAASEMPEPNGLPPEQSITSNDFPETNPHALRNWMV
jgi:hypothetical protein